MKVAVIGTGAYGLALAKMIHKNCEVVMWTENEEVMKEATKKRKLDSILPGVSIPKDFSFTTSYEEAISSSDVVFIAVSAKYVESVAKGIAPFLSSKTPVCLCSKGIIEDQCVLVHEAFLKYVKTKHYAVISGPSFAIDIAKGEPVGLSLATTSKRAKTMITDALASDSVKLRSTDDIIGVEICGSIKNVIAVAAGILSGLGYSESTSAFLITEALHDIKELITKLGGNAKTILSFAGVGDLLLTCTSTKSRNYSFGVCIGSQKGAEKYLETHTVEGYHTLQAIYRLVRRKKIRIPIIDLIYRIVIQGEDPNLLASFLIHKK